MATEANQALAAHAQALFDEAAGRGQRAIDKVTDDLVQFAGLLLHQVRLRKALADPGLPPEPKQALLTELGQGRLDEASVELLATATASRSGCGTSPELLASLAAKPPSPPPTRPASRWLEGELFGVATLVEQEHGLRSALTSPGLPVENKRALLADLLRGASRRTAALADLLVELQDYGWTPWPGSGRRRRRPPQPRGGRGAQLRRARRPAPGHLAEALTRAIGKPVVLQMIVDETILGSVVVRVGDELFDGSIRSRLEQAREALGVAWSQA